MKNRNFSKNQIWYKKSKMIIPAACSTLAKSPSRLIQNHSPFCCSSAKGSHFIDVDGNKWLDCEMAMGTIVWGHNPEFLKDVIIEQIEKGISFSLAGENELEYADMLIKKFPCYNSLKFFKNGADAVYATIRLCRFLNKKEKILSCEYHGWLDWCSYSYYQKEPQELGITQDILNTTLWCLPNVESIISIIQKNYKTLSCVVLCPANYTKEDLMTILLECHKYNIYLIFDEITSGVRYGYRGVTGTYEIYPDFLCLSKGLTNGLPLAVCMGKEGSILTMEELKISNAHSSENLSIAAAIACEKEMQHSQYWPSWQYEGNLILEEIENKIISQNLDEILFLKGYAGNFHLFSQKDFYTDPFRELLICQLSKEGIFSKGFILFSAAHTSAEMQLVKQIILDCIITFASWND